MTTGLTQGAPECNRLPAPFAIAPVLPVPLSVHSGSFALPFKSKSS